MSDREKAIKVLEKMPDDISMEEILETLNLIFDLKNRIDNFNEDETISHENLKKEIKKW